MSENRRSIGYDLFILVCGFVMMFSIASLISVIPMSAGLTGRPLLLVQSCIQNVVAFAGAAFIVSYFCSFGHALSFLRLDRGISLRAVFGILLLYVLMMPLLNQIIYWNAEMHLPDSMSGFEATLRRWEESNGKLSEMILATKSVGGLVVNVLIVGALTGFCEESFFRGTLQRMMTSRGVNHHFAVWAAAFIFSAVHFQFFGFIPRMLLGALFGYLLWSTKSLWASALAHALNNSIVVVVSWLAANGYVSDRFETAGISEHGFPSYAVISAVAVALFIYFLWQRLFKKE